MCNICKVFYIILYSSYPAGRPFYYESDGTRILNSVKGTQETQENNNNQL